MRRRLPAHVALLLAVPLVSCDETPQPPAALVRDSAGILISEYAEAPGPGLPVWRLEEPERAVVGRDESLEGHALSHVVGAIRLSDGRIAIGDAQTREIRIFAEDGTLLKRAGGDGGGPGEFGRQLRSVDPLPGDSLVGGDWPVGLVSVFDAEGTFIEQRTLGQYIPGLLGHILWDGSLLVDAYERGSYGNEIEVWAAFGTEPRFRPSGKVVRVTLDGQVDTLRDITGPAFFKTGTPRQNLISRPLPFSSTTLVAWSPTRLFLTETGSREVQILTFDGTVERLIRWQGEDHPVTAEDRSRHRDGLLTGLRRSQQRPGLERWLAEVEYPALKPPVLALAVDRSGRLWVREWSAEAGPFDRWIVVLPDGTVAALAQVPAGLDLLDLGEDYALARYTSDLDVEEVRLYTLQK
ncbi:MAG: hypothetical protein PVH00_07170 [Gemmatimonadota bacterium]|jgi:hypothetical protein